MQRHLFFCGDDALALIERALGEGLASAGGYVTRAVSTPDGTALGLGLLPSAALGGIEGYEPQLTLRFTPEGIVRDNEVFRTEAVRLLREAEYYPFALVAELGGFELVIPQYRAELEGLLRSPLPCIGVLKTPEEARMTARMLGLGERFDALYEHLRRALDEDADTLLLTVEGEEDERGIAAAESWSRSYAE